MRQARPLLLMLIVTAAAMLPTACDSKSSSPSSGLKYPTVTINGHVWNVEVAATAQQRYAGLSGRTVGSSSGMLFIYPEPQVLTFCMRGCPRPIDIAFLDSGRRIVRIHTMLPEPGLAGEEHYSSDSPAQYAFETAGGALSSAGVKVGDTATFSSDIPEPAKAESGP